MTIPANAGVAGSYPQVMLSSPRAKIMIVDDARTTMLLLKACLEDAGYSRFVTCEQSTEAMSLLLTERPDVLLLDLHMPEVNGFDILAEVRASIELRHLPVLMLTASEDASDKLRALELGVTDFLAKPVDTSELLLRLRNTLIAKHYQDRLSFYDALTELPNRGRFIQLFTHCLEHARRNGEVGAVLHVDLDRFRQMNDSLGHSAGDRLLRVVANRLSRSVGNLEEICASRHGEVYASASRLSGDEFTVLLPKVNGASNALKVAEHIRRELAEPIPWDRGDLVVTASVGVLTFDKGADAVETLMGNAALATARSKQLGGNRCEVFCHVTK